MFAFFYIKVDLVHCQVNNEQILFLLNAVSVVANTKVLGGQKSDPKSFGVRCDRNLFKEKNQTSRNDFNPVQ
jgi:hypothetical protein